MALIVKDRVQETTTTIGTGTLTLDGSPDGFQTFSSAIGDTNTTYYAISSSGTEFEVGIGTVGAGTLARTTILASSNGGSVVTLSAGTKNVFCTLPAVKTISPVMDPTTYVVTHNSTLSDDQVLDSGVLAGPVTITGAQTVTGTLVIL
jgi:hypothetical protein